MKIKSPEQERYDEMCGEVSSREATDAEIEAWAVKEEKKLRDAKIAKLKAALK